MPQFTLFLLAFSFCFTSCVKDTDFNQADQIELNSVVELNFLFFTLQIDDFKQNPGLEGSLTVVDTTEVRFLNESFAQENLWSAEYFFRVSNSFPIGANANFTFLSDTNESFYVVSFPIQTATNNTPVVTEFTQVITLEEIALLTQTTKIVVTITLDTLDENLSGTMNLQSKTTYFLKF
ncbi:MAG: hypothetical protein CVU03_04575 [Bacteroidetes bacterium HGW-Bacteroidetes-2]|jgi:hypothetical protein|nr:MAG: hypothetical protein CVU03_04575 [Bacteroidetes bacterium HGW-Bacteroidetes-2]